METTLGQTLDSLTTYAVALVTLLFAFTLSHSSTVMTIGGFILLGLRLYVDGSKAWRAYKRNKAVANGDMSSGPHDD